MGCPFEYFMRGSGSGSRRATRRPKKFHWGPTILAIIIFFGIVYIYERHVKIEGVTILQRGLLILSFIYLLFLRFMKISVSDDNPPHYLNNKELVLSKTEALLHIATMLIMTAIFIIKRKCTKFIRILVFVLILVQIPIAIVPMYQSKRYILNTEGIKTFVVGATVLLLILNCIKDCTKWVGWTLILGSLFSGLCNAPFHAPHK